VSKKDRANIMEICARKNRNELTWTEAIDEIELYVQKEKIDHGIKVICFTSAVFLIGIILDHIFN